MITNLQFRTFRVHLSIIGYFAYCFSTLYFGKHPWDECLLIDKIISFSALVMIVQTSFMSREGVSKGLNRMQILAAIVFLMICVF
jgi:hypothetical protein